MAEEYTENYTAAMPGSPQRSSLDAGDCNNSFGGRQSYAQHFRPYVPPAQSIGEKRKALGVTRDELEGIAQRFLLLQLKVNGISPLAPSCAKISRAKHMPSSKMSAFTTVQIPCD